MIRYELPGYPLVIGSLDSVGQALEEALRAKAWSRVAVLADENTARDCWPLLTDLAWPDDTEVLELPAGEAYTTIGTCEGIWEAFLELGMDRHSLLVNLGGGVIGDMGGFAASTFMRGMAFLNLPTTLLAQVDASVGGKLGVDFQPGEGPAYKNLIGLFGDPQAVLMAPAFLATLPPEQQRSGFAEVLKHALIRDAAEWARLEEAEAPADEAAWERLIAHSVAIKRDVVAADRTETSLRKILNYGHTVGHAIESLQLHTDAPLLHGEAVAVGMVAEAWLSAELCGLPAEERDRLAGGLRRWFPPADLSACSPEAVLDAMGHDKKNRAGAVRLALLERIGHAVPEAELPADRALALVGAALDYYRERFGA